MARCGGFKPDGTPCERIVGASQSYCYSHDPERSGERSRNAARAARSKPNREIAALKDQAATLYSEVHGGYLEPAVGAVLVQVLNAQVRILESERRIRETAEFEERIAALEGAPPSAS